MPRADAICNSDDLLDETVAAVRAAVEDGDRDSMRGGVPIGEIALRIGRSRGAVLRRVRPLVDRGELAIVHGQSPSGRARKSYLPADHPDVGGGA